MTYASLSMRTTSLAAMASLVLTMFLSVAMAAVSLALSRALRRFGIAIAAMMAMIATTIISSMRVKPALLLDMRASAPGC